VTPCPCADQDGTGTKENRCETGQRTCVGARARELGGRGRPAGHGSVRGRRGSRIRTNGAAGRRVATRRRHQRDERVSCRRGWTGRRTRGRLRRPHGGAQHERDAQQHGSQADRRPAHEGLPSAATHRGDPERVDVVVRRVDAPPVETRDDHRSHSPRSRQSFATLAPPGPALEPEKDEDDQDRRTEHGRLGCSPAVGQDDHVPGRRHEGLLMTTAATTGRRR